MSKLIGMSHADLFKAAQNLTANELAEDLRLVSWPEPNIPVMSSQAKFFVACASVRITDPAFSLTCDQRGQSAGTLENVKNGQWLASVQTQHYEADITRSKYWHNQRIDNLVTKDQERTHDDMSAYFLNGDLGQVVYDYKKATEGCGPISFLHIQHAELDEPVSATHAGYEKLPYRIDMESGTAGFFDFEWIKSQHPPEAPKEPFSLAWFEGVSDDMAYGLDPGWQAFYSAMSELTPPDTLFGTCEHAALAYGCNGSPECFVKRDETGAVVAARIVFIPPKEFAE